mgnify:CR=1 FL=1
MTSGKLYLILHLFLVASLTVSAQDHRDSMSDTWIASDELNRRTPPSKSSYSTLQQHFIHPPDSARPGVYWYFMDGNISREGMTKDLESMKEAGIGNLVFLEVNVGVPRGKVDFMSEEWLDLFTHAVREAERLGIAITLGVGPGWTGSGGPWVEGRESMQHLVSSTIEVEGPAKVSVKLPVPRPRDPYFGLNQFPGDLKSRWESYYEDAAVLAFPASETEYRIAGIDDKALYYRAPYTSKPGVKQFLTMPASHEEPSASSVISKNQVYNISEHMKPDGTLEWEVPPGKWTVMRLGSRNNGAVTRPAPLPGVGFEADKFDTTAINAHLGKFIGTLLKHTGVPRKDLSGGLKMLHMDSWEMGAQNWSGEFRNQFMLRRGYDPMPFFPVYSGLVVESLEISERFLWDVRLTAQELILENHAKHLKKYAERYNRGLSVEPYDMNPTADMVLGAVADVPMCEFWTKDYGYNSSWSCIQAASIAHIGGQQVVAAEAFTAHLSAWKHYPGSMKNQGDWAFAAGVNRLVYHTFQHQALHDSLRPGMTMGPYGIHHDRGQTWWPMASAYHTYVTRCQYLLQQGRPVADILYLTPEGAPHIFRAPKSALAESKMPDMKLVTTDQKKPADETRSGEFMPDRKGYNFSGCSPEQLFTASVRDSRIHFPSGASFPLMVMPAVETMTPELLRKIMLLISEGAVVIGEPPVKSPSLVNYPACDKQIKEMAGKVWGGIIVPEEIREIRYGKGRIYRGGLLSKPAGNELYPQYEVTADVLKAMGIQEDFSTDGPVRYIHRKLDNSEFFFVSGKSPERITATCSFRAEYSHAELWDPLTGEILPLVSEKTGNGITRITLTFEPYQSFFIFFSGNRNRAAKPVKQNSIITKDLAAAEGSWEVFFDPGLGGPGNTVFEELHDWTANPDDRIRYYSGIATYRKTINLPANLKIRKNEAIYLELGEVHNLARVMVNGSDMGVAWTAPWRVRIDQAVKPGKNEMEIQVANLWPNRLIGDENLPFDGIVKGQWPDWLLEGKPRTSGRVTFTTFSHFRKDSELFRSGLIGPVRVVKTKPGRPSR